MEISNAFLVLVPVIVGVVQVVKVAGVPRRLLPASALVLGIIGAGVLAGFTGSTALGGIIAGLTSVGLWSGTKATVKAS